MSLHYKSTRNSELKVTASEAILKGLAPDGGLFVPEEIPKLDVSMEQLKSAVNEVEQPLKHYIPDCVCYGIYRRTYCIVPKA